MTKQYKVEFGNPPDHVKFNDRPIIFHGINKSGSGAMANVIYQAFCWMSCEQRVKSRYHGNPRTNKEILSLIDRTLFTEPVLFIDHYLYGAVNVQWDPPFFITQFRHPLPRIISCHSWIQKKHRETNASGKSMSLEEFILRGQGKAHTQISQFGIGYGPNRRALMRSTSAKEMYQICKENVQQNVSWFGIAEMFEESIFILSYLLGIEQVPVWRQDRRNPNRVSAFSVSSRIRKLIEKEYEYEFLFYEEMTKNFKERIQNIEFGKQFLDYKEACAAEYKDRILL